MSRLYPDRKTASQRLPVNSTATQAADRWRFEANGALTVAALGFGVLIAAGFATEIDGRLDLLSHLRAHLAAGLVVVAGLFGLTRAWFRATLAAVIAGAGLATILDSTVLKAAAPVAGPADLTVIHFNTQGPLNARGADIAAYLADSPADIVVLLEAGSVAPNMPALRGAFPHTLPCDLRQCDLLILSRLPITNARRDDLLYVPNRYVTLGVETEIGPVTLVATHVSKPWHGGLQAHHLETIADRLNRIDGPLVVAGDFNATPWSRDMRSFMAHAGVKRLPGFNASWPSEAGPFGFPIDHLMVRGGINPIDIVPLPESFSSNHRGFIARFRLAR